MSTVALGEVERLRRALYNAQLTLDNIATEERAEGRRNSMAAQVARAESEAIRAVLRVIEEGGAKR